MKSALLSFLITGALIVVLNSALLRHSANRSPGGSAETNSVPDSPGNHGTGSGAAAAGLSAEGGREAVSPEAALARKSAPLIAEARQYASKPPNSGNLTAWWNAICELAELDPELAIRTLREAPAGFSNSDPYPPSGNAQSIVAWWLAKDPEAALAWYWRDLETSGKNKTAPDPPDEIVETLAARGLPGALNILREWFARKLAPDSLDGYGVIGDGLHAKEGMGTPPILKTLIPYLKTAADLQQLLPEKAGYGRPDQWPVYWQGLAHIAAQALPQEEARAFIERNSYPGKWPEDYLHPAVSLMDAAVKNKTLGDAADWADWVIQNVGPEVQLRSQAAVHLLNVWTAKDPEAAGNWLRIFADANPASAPLAMKAYARAVMDENPSAAMEWVTAIPQEPARRMAMIQLFPKWAEQDAPAARAWLEEKSSWPPEMKRLGEGALKSVAPGS